MIAELSWRDAGKLVLVWFFTYVVLTVLNIFTELSFWPFFVSLALGIGALTTYLFWRQLQRILLLRDIPTRTVRSIPLGLVEICGGIRNTADAISPVTKQPCVGFTVVVERLESVGKQKRWRTKARKVEIPSTFWVDDGTGVVPVHVNTNTSMGRQDAKDGVINTRIDDEELLLKTSFEESTKRLIGAAKPSPEFSSFLDEVGITYAASWRAAPIRVSERRLDAEDEVYVLGRAVRLDDGELCIVRDVQTSVFAVSNKGEEAVFWKSVKLAALHFSLSLVSITGSLFFIVF